MKGGQRREREMLANVFRFLFGEMRKIFYSLIMVIDAQVYKQTEKNCIAYFKWVNFIACKLLSNLFVKNNFNWQSASKLYTNCFVSLLFIREIIEFSKCELCMILESMYFMRMHTYIDTGTDEKVFGPHLGEIIGMNSEKYLDANKHIVLSFGKWETDISPLAWISHYPWYPLYTFFHKSFLDFLDWSLDSKHESLWLSVSSM